MQILKCMSDDVYTVLKQKYEHTNPDKWTWIKMARWNPSLHTLKPVILRVLSDSECSLLDAQLTLCLPRKLHSKRLKIERGCIEKPFKPVQRLDSFSRSHLDWQVQYITSTTCFREAPNYRIFIWYKRFAQENLHIFYIFIEKKVRALIGTCTKSGCTSRWKTLMTIKLLLFSFSTRMPFFLL